MDRLRRIPWNVWALLAPALIIGAVKLGTGGATAIAVVGAGPIAELRPGDAPAGVRLDLDVVPAEPIGTTAERLDLDVVPAEPIGTTAERVEGVIRG